MESSWNPVVQWLNEVRQSAEIESLSALQAKSVALKPDAQDALAVRNAQIAMQTVRKNSQIVIKQLFSLIEQLPLSMIHIESFRIKFLDLCTPLCQLLEMCRRRCALQPTPTDPCKSVCQDSTSNSLISSMNGNCGTIVSSSKQPMLGSNNAECNKSLNSCDKSTTGQSMVNTSNVPSSDLLYENVCGDSKQILRLLHSFHLNKQVHNLSLDSALKRLLSDFQKLIEFTLLGDSSRLVDCLYMSSRDGLALKWSLLALWQLTQTDLYFRTLFSCRASVLKPLANLLSDVCSNNALASSSSSGSCAPAATCAVRSRHDQLRCAALRVFTHLCARPEIALIVCSRTAIGPRLTRLLNTRSPCSHSIRLEGVRLVVQLTRALSCESEAQVDAYDPFDQLALQMQNEYIQPLPSQTLSDQIAAQLSLDQIVECLTGLLIEGGEQDNVQLLLLCLAAFANISFVDCYPFMRHRTLQVVLHVLDLNFDLDRPEVDKSLLTHHLPLLDQLLTLLANLADQNPSELMDGRALHLLVQSLQPRFGNGCTVEPQVQERVQQKAATAIGRLVLHVPLATAISRMHVLDRLIRLCVDPKLRNHSEHVLLAALAALRRAAVTLGPEPFERLQRLDLIQLPLKDVFAKYAAGHELYV